jgi:hypothetical protein
MNSQYYLSKIPSFGDLESHLYSKFAIKRSDAQLAVAYLRCFLAAKLSNPQHRIILPQIADWAWHELILDTRRYEQLCLLLYGKLLAHVADDIDNPARNNRLEFKASMEFMQSVYGLGLGEDPDDWTESGWGKPLYRLRTPIKEARNSTRFSIRPPNPEFNQFYEDILSWLPSRLTNRFGISEYSARQGVHEHVSHLLTLRDGDQVDKRSAICEIAWQEHILWIDHYSDDCNYLLGYFLHHPPKPVLPYKETIEVRVASA